MHIKKNYNIVILSIGLLMLAKVVSADNNNVKTNKIGFFAGDLITFKQKISKKELEQDFSDIKGITISWLKNSSLYKNKKEIDTLCKKISESNFKYKGGGIMLIHPYIEPVRKNGILG